MRKILVFVAACFMGAGMASPVLAQPAPANSGMEIHTKKARSGYTVIDTVGDPTTLKNAKKRCLSSYQTGQTPVAYFNSRNNSRLRYMLTQRDGDSWSLWIGTRQGVNGDCFVLNMAGTRLTLSDYKVDKNQASSNAYYWNRTSVDAGSKCVKIARDLTKRAKRPMTCLPFGDYDQAMRTQERREIAFTGTINAPDGPYILYGYVTGGGDLLVAQTDRDGATVPVLAGTNFAFSVGASNTVFAKRIAAEDAANREKQRLAKIEKDRRDAANRQRAIEREQQRIAKYNAARASETPDQRLWLNYMDDVVAEDSRSWYLYKYQRGTMHNLRVWRNPRYPKTDILMKADYFFNKDSTGDVTFRMINGRLTSIDFWDDSPRAPNVGPNKLYSGIAVAVLIAMATASAQ